MNATTVAYSGKPQIPWSTWRHWSKNQRNAALVDHELCPPTDTRISERRRVNGWDKNSTFDKNGRPLD